MGGWVWVGVGVGGWEGDLRTTVRNASSEGQLNADVC